MVEHTIRAFDTDLQELVRKIADMGRLDDEQIASATEALMKRDTVLARRVIMADDRVDALQRDIEEKAITTIARRQPMAVDLREIVGALRISNDLERVGDLAENIAKR
jgi:phosphate transport system protein